VVPQGVLHLPSTPQPSAPASAPVSPLIPSPPPPSLSLSLSHTHIHSPFHTHTHSPSHVLAVMAATAQKRKTDTAEEHMTTGCSFLPLVSPDNVACLTVTWGQIEHLANLITINLNKFTFQVQPAEKLTIACVYDTSSGTKKRRHIIFPSITSPYLAEGDIFDESMAVNAFTVESHGPSDDTFRIKSEAIVGETVGCTPFSATEMATISACVHKAFKWPIARSKGAKKAMALIDEGILILS